MPKSPSQAARETPVPAAWPPLSSADASAWLVPPLLLLLLLLLVKDAARAQGAQVVPLYLG